MQDFRAFRIHEVDGRITPRFDQITLEDLSPGEVVVRGYNVMQGYFGNDAATAEVIDADGWLHTGDIGELDTDGYLKITDRKKELLKTAGGKYIAPQPIEMAVKRNKFVANAMLYGDRRKFPIILIVPNFDNLERWAQERSLTYGSRGQLIELADVQAKVEREVMSMLSHLARFETPKKVLLLENDFTIENGELTPTLKVKRRVVYTRYAREIDAMYEADRD